MVHLQPTRQLHARSQTFITSRHCLLLVVSCLVIYDFSINQNQISHITHLLPTSHLNLPHSFNLLTDSAILTMYPLYLTISRSTFIIKRRASFFTLCWGMLRLKSIALFLDLRYYLSKIIQVHIAVVCSIMIWSAKYGNALHSVCHKDQPATTGPSPQPPTGPSPNTTSITGHGRELSNLAKLYTDEAKERMIVLPSSSQYSTTSVLEPTYPRRQNLRLFLLCSKV